MYNNKIWSSRTWAANLALAEKKPEKYSGLNGTRTRAFQILVERYYHLSYRATLNNSAHFRGFVDPGGIW